MITQKELVDSKEYILAKMQIDLYDAVNAYLKANNMKKSDFAKQLGVSKGYISQILNGDFDHKLSKFVALSLAIGKIPVFELVDQHTKGNTKKPSTQKTREASYNRMPASRSISKKGAASPKSGSFVEKK